MVKTLNEKLAALHYLESLNVIERVIRGIVIEQVA